MSSAIMMERTGMGMPGLGMPGLGTSSGTPTGMPMNANWLVVPRCTFKIEKTSGGMRLTCHCDDKTSCSMVQNLCTMLSGGMCSCCVTLNGMTVCYLNLTMGMCKCEMTESGVCIHCTSGDSHCLEMIQACCECLCCMLDAGCNCCLLLNNTPVCCGGCDSAKGSAKSKR